MGKKKIPFTVWKVSDSAGDSHMKKVRCDFSADEWWVSLVCLWLRRYGQAGKTNTKTVCGCQIYSKPVGNLPSLSNLRWLRGEFASKTNARTMSIQCVFIQRSCQQAPESFKNRVFWLCNFCSNSVQKARLDLPQLRTEAFQRFFQRSLDFNFIEPPQTTPLEVARISVQYPRFSWFHSRRRPFVFLCGL